MTMSVDDPWQDHLAERLRSMAIDTPSHMRAAVLAGCQPRRRPAARHRVARRAMLIAASAAGMVVAAAGASY